MPPRKYSGPLQPGKKSAYVKGTRKRAPKKSTVKSVARLNYRTPLTYTFCRETIPETIPFHEIAAGTNFPAMGYLNFDNLQFNQLVEATTEFGSLFARYKVDKIVTTLTPMFSQAIAITNESSYNNSGNLRITKVNTKWFNEEFTIQSDADDQLKALAQIQAKSIRSYATTRNLTLVTKYPRIVSKGVVDASNTELEVNKPMPWLNIANQSDVPLKHNSLIFAERIDGGGIDNKWKYRVVHKIYFRCAQVG